MMPRNNHATTSPSISFARAVALLSVSLACLVVGLVYLKLPSTITLILTGSLSACLLVFWGISWDRIQADIVANLASIMVPILILLAVGMLIGIWIQAGIVPLLIYHGLRLLSPGIFLVVTALICAVMSLATGTSWGTAGTMGIALMGVATGLGIPAPMAAGAVIVGAIFGDKLSPLSDTTILAPAMSGVEVMDHVKHMLWTTVPSFLVSLGLYAYLGAGYSGQILPTSLDSILSLLSKSFVLSPVLLLPPVLVIFLILMKWPTLPTFFVGIVTAVVLAMVVQGDSIVQVAKAMNGGFTTKLGLEVVDKMLMRGGLQSMLGSVALIIGSVVFGSPLQTAGVFEALVTRIESWATSQRRVALSGIGLHSLLFLVIGSYYVTFAIVGPLLKGLYNKKGLDGTNLSRTLEDTGTALAPLVPWSVTGVYMATTLSVPTGQYWAYAPMLYLGIVFAIFYAATGIGMAKVKGQGMRHPGSPSVAQRS